MPNNTPYLGFMFHVSDLNNKILLSAVLPKSRFNLFHIVCEKYCSVPQVVCLLCWNSVMASCSAQQWPSSQEARRLFAAIVSRVKKNGRR
jgi:hypothetical protein